MKLREETWMDLGTINMLNTYKQDKWFENISSNPKCEYYIINTEKEKIGLVRMDEIDYINRSIRVGGDIKTEFRNKGYGTLMMELILVYCFNYLNFNRIWLMVMNNNFAAKKIYKKLGFKEEGRQREALYRTGSYHDYIMMSILKEEYKCMN